MKRLLFLLFLTSTATFYAQNKSSWWEGRTCGDMPYMEYSQGEVRLGADKISFLDTAIRMVVIDSSENRYKVKLSEKWDAFIPKSSIERVGEVEEDSLANFSHLVESWHLTSVKDEDVLTLSVDEKLPYKSFEYAGSNTIVVDLFGAVSNTTWITQLKSAKIVKNVFPEQVEPDVYRINIELHGKQNWGYRIGYEEDKLKIKVKHAPEKRGIRNLFIAIDAGHGGDQSGAISSSGTREKDYTLKFALELQKLFKRRGVKNVYMTRESDIDFPTPERVLELREVRPDLLISLHLNSAGKPEVSGVSTYYKHQKNRLLAQSILDEMLDLKLNEFGLIGNFNFLLNSPIEYPNTLVEIAFLSNPDDELKIKNTRFQRRTARKIFRGVKKWLRNVQ